MAEEMQYTNAPVFQSLNHLPAIQVSNEVETNIPHETLELQVPQAKASENSKLLLDSPTAKADQCKLISLSQRLMRQTRVQKMHPF